MNNRKKYWSIGIFSLVIISFLTLSLASNPSIIQGASSEEGVQYNSMVCTGVQRADGSSEHLGCTSNLVTQVGLDAIGDLIQGGGGAAFSYIALCNTTAGCTDPAAGDTTLDAEYTSGGLARVAGAVVDLDSTTGNTSISTTFTATLDSLETNMTGLFNASSSGTLLAENSFTSVTLQTNDQLTVNWSVWFS